MLKEATQKRIATLLKIKPEDLAAALKDEKEVDLAIDEKIATYSDDDLAKVKSNGYKEGKIAGEEMAVDEVKKEMALDFEGKNVKLLAKEVAKKTLADAKIEPEKKVTELTEKVKTLQGTVKEYETKLSEKDNEVLGIKRTTELSKFIPADASIAGDKIVKLMEMDGYEFKYEDGKMIPYKAGVKLVDKLGEALLPKDVVSGYVTENKLIPVAAGGAGGRGGGDSTKQVGIFTKLSEVREKFKAEGKSELGEEFANAVKEAAKTEGFDMNT